MDTLLTILKLLIYATGAIAFIYCGFFLILHMVSNFKYRRVYDHEDHESRVYILKQTLIEVLFFVAEITIVASVYIVHVKL